MGIWGVHTSFFEMDPQETYLKFPEKSLDMIHLSKKVNEPLKPKKGEDLVQIVI